VTAVAAALRAGRPRRTPICDGLDADASWVVSQDARRSGCVRDIDVSREAPRG
jgi:hypothetical protein